MEQVPWRIHWGGLGNPHGGLEGLLSKCRLGGTTFYVRENIAVNHFMVSAGERMGWKRGQLSKRHTQILELLAPESEWSRIAAIVSEVDPLNRSVRKNRTFTTRWAEAILIAGRDNWARKPLSLDFSSL